MKIEQIETNKIRVVFSKDDLDNRQINFHSLMSNSKQTQNLFLAILDIAEKEIGFETSNYDIAIETLVLENSDFILTISRRKSEKKDLHKGLNVSRKCFDFSNSFKFNNFDDFYEFFNKVKFLLKFNKTLFYFNNNFYYIYDENRESKNDYSKAILLEYASPCFVPRDLIKTYGKAIL